MTDTEQRTMRPVEDVLRRVVLIFRILSLFWMGGLVTATLLSDEGASRPWVYTAMGVAVAMTVGTWFAAKSRERMASWWWLTIDGAAAFFVGISPGLSGADDLFYGGIPLSWLLLVVYAHSSFILGGIAVGVLTVTQLVIAALDPDPLSPTEYVGRIAVWVVSALAYGWTMWALRESEKQRIGMERERDEARVQRRVADERAELAARLHDSVLQTLALVQRDADDGHSVRWLARKQELELRNMIEQMSSPFENGFRTAVRAAAADVEDRFRVRIDAVIVGDREVNPALSGAVDAAREAMVNAAKHSGVAEIALSCEVEPDRVVIAVRDRGRGFDPAAVADRGGFGASIVRRVERCGGTVRVESRPGRGTEVEITMPVDCEEGDG